MDILILNGGTAPFKNTYNATKMIKDTLIDRGHKGTVGSDSVTDCLDCGFCKYNGICCIYDKYTELLNKKFNWILILSPIFFFGLSGKVRSMIDRLYSVDLEGKLLSTITFSGSSTEEDSGYDIVWEQIRRICNYCGMIEGKSVNFVTNDMVLDLEVVKDNIISILEENEVLYEVKEEK